MSWKGFMRGLRAVMPEPDYLRKLTPEQRAERTRQSARQNMFAVQMFDPPEPRPYKEPSVPPDDKGGAVRLAGCDSSAACASLPDRAARIERA
jgi:hypothetical protein